MKSLIIFSVCFSLLCSAASLLGTKNCVWGPSYWCSHVKRAKECGAFKHCMDTIWSLQVIKQTTPSAECTLCQMVVNETRLMVKSNTSEAAIIEFFQKACNFMPSDQLKTACNDMVKNNVDSLIKLLRSNLTSEKICAAMGICEGFDDHIHKVAGKQQKIEPVTSVAPRVVKKTKICTDCENFFQDVHNMVQDNETVAQIKDTLKQLLCSQLASVEGLCDFVVDEYVPIAMQYLATEVDPGVVCRVIGFCNGTDIYKAMRVRIQLRSMLKKFNKNRIGGTEECNMCETVVTEVRNLDRDANNQKKVEDFLQKALCTKLGSLEAECKKVILDYGPILFELIANEMDPVAVCTFIGFCHTRVSKEMKIKEYEEFPPMIFLSDRVLKEAEAGELCEACELVVKELDTMLTSKPTETEIENALKMVCSRLPENFNQKCQDIVSEYTPAILELLSKELDPKTICTEIRLCTAKKAVKKPVKAGELCALCELVMQQLDSVLAKNATEQEIENAIKGLCNKLPNSIKAQCDDFVNQYGPAVLKLLVQNLDPKKVCQTLNLCPAQMSRPKKLLPVIDSKVQAGPQCVLCEFVMFELSTLLKKNSSQAEIETVLGKVCNLLPHTISTECKDFVQTYATLIIQLLLKEVTPEKICTTLNLCTSSAIVAKPVQKLLDIAPLSMMPIPGQYSKVQAGPQCVLCEFVMFELGTLLKKNSSQAEIETVLGKVCNLLPHTISTECKDFVQTYATLIIQLLLKEVTPEKICTTLNLCTSSAIVAKPVQKPLDIAPLSMMPIPGQLPVKVTNEECLVCKTIITYLDALMGENKTEQALEAALRKVCDLLPAEYKKQCDSLVKQYGPAIEQLLAQIMDPNKVCTGIGVCPSDTMKLFRKLKDTTLRFKKKSHLLGEKKCTYGPAYWCDNMENAKKCGAVEHCVKHVWQNQYMTYVNK